MNYGNIKECDIANGPGPGPASLYPAAGITVKAALMQKPGIFGYGKPFTEETGREILRLAGNRPDIQGFTVLGGEPFEPENQPAVAELLKQIRMVYPQKDIWCYSGYLYDSDMQPGGRVYTEHTQEILKCLDVLVDGEFVEAEKDLTLVFRGSSNQRLLKLKDGIACGNWP